MNIFKKSIFLNKNKSPFIKSIYAICFIITIYILFTSFFSNSITNKVIDKSLLAIIDSGYNKNDLVSSIYDDHVLNERSMLITYNVFDKTTSVDDKNGHGTKLMASLVNDINGNLRYGNYLIIKAVNDDGTIKSDNLVKAIDYACDKKATVINMSFSFDNVQNNVKEAIEKCYIKNKDVIFVASAGDIDSKKIMFPANMDKVVSVASMTNIGKKEYLSSKSDDVNVVIDMNDNVVCLKEKCLFDSTASLATIKVSSYILEKQIKQEAVNLLNGKLFLIPENNYSTSPR